MKIEIAKLEEFIEADEILELAKIGIVHQLSVIENRKDKSARMIRDRYLSLLYKVDKEIIALEDQFQRELYVEIISDMG